VRPSSVLITVAELLINDCGQGQRLPQPQKQIRTVHYGSWEEGDAIKHAITIGSTTWNGSEDEGSMPFFTPDQPSPMRPSI